MKKNGKVFLVGAGPGDPGLITRRGADLIQLADVIVVDALVNPALLRTEKTKRIIYVGKRGPGAPSGASVRLPQKGICALLVRLAREGQRVVRLKGGDPFVFGRGGEEMAALSKANIDFEIVPGISSAIAAPAYAGIPVSDRRWASQVTFLTGYESKEERALTPGVDWKSLSPQGTLVVLMGVSAWPSIQKKLLQAGWPASKPIAAIESGTWSTQREIMSTLTRSVVDFKRARLAAPAVIVVGDVAHLGKQFNWLRQQKPLLGKKVVVTRGVHQNFEMTAFFEEKGAEVIACPAIRVIPLVDDPLVRRVIQQLENKSVKYDGVLFLSVNAVRTFSRLLAGSPVMGRQTIFAVGPQTAEALHVLGWPLKRMAREFNSRGVIKMLGNVKGKTFLIPRVQNGPADLIDALKKKGARVEEINVYKTLPAAPPSREVRRSILSGVDAVTFTSSSTVRYFLSFFSRQQRSAIFSRAVAISIGPSTTQTLREMGIKKIIQSKKATVMDMIDRFEQI